MVELLMKFSWIEWIVFGLISNLILFVMSICFYLFIEKTCSKPQLQNEPQAILKKDLFLSFITIFCNTIVMLLAVFLWKKDWILISDNSTFWIVLLQVVALIFVMDFLMYWFHRIAHFKPVYELVHGKHHEHVSVNFLSLFVLHPFESIGFGIIMILVLIGFEFSIYSVVVYVFVNLIWGTIGHLNKEFFPKSWERFGIGTSKFHNHHHLFENKNFGFYTSIWDRLLGTYKG